MATFGDDFWQNLGGFCPVKVGIHRMPSECQLNDNFLARIFPILGEILITKTLHSLECRVNADF